MNTKDPRINLKVARTCRNCHHYKTIHVQKRKGLCRPPEVKFQSLKKILDILGDNVFITSSLCVCDRHVFKRNSHKIPSNIVKDLIFFPDGLTQKAVNDDTDDWD